MSKSKAAPASANPAPAPTDKPKHSEPTLGERVGVIQDRLVANGSAPGDGVLVRDLSDVLALLKDIVIEMERA